MIRLTIITQVLIYQKKDGCHINRLPKFGGIRVYQRQLKIKVLDIKGIKEGSVEVHVSVLL